MSSEDDHNGNAVLRHLPYYAVTVVLLVFLVAVWAIMDQSNSALTRGIHETLGDPAQEWGLSGLYLLLALPFGAIVVVFVRTILGWQTFGLFTPMLLALSYLQAGPILGPTISTAAILVGMVAAPILKKLELSRVAFLGALISIVVTTLGSVAVSLDKLVLISAYPIVVTALVVERWWTTWEADGLRKALKITGTTLFVAMVIQFTLASVLLRQLVETAPLGIPIFAGVMMILLGRYKGLRLSEITRFRAAKGD